MATAEKFVQPIPIFFFLIMLFNYSSSSSFFLPPKVYPTHFSATTERKSMKLHWNVNFFNAPKAVTHYGGYSYKVS
jgi:hypothetical protein